MNGGTANTAPIARNGAPDANMNAVFADNPLLSLFYAQFTRYAAPEDLAHYTGSELAALVAKVFEVTRQRPQGTALLESFATKTLAGFERDETILVALNADMPFLYDSAIAELRAQGHDPHAVFHPIISTARDDAGMRVPGTGAHESIIVFALDPGIADEALAQLKDALAKIFADVRAAVRDWKKMMERMAETIADLKAHPPSIADDELHENLAFLVWLADNHFTFLGARDYDFHQGGGENDATLEARYDSGLGLLADPGTRVIRRGADRMSLSPEVREFLMKSDPLIITKSNTRSTVHRHVHMDYIGVKRFDSTGALIGERRFVGLFTSTAYSQLPAAIPLLRRKASYVMEHSGLAPSSHDGKALAHIVANFPRDELFQISGEDLLATALGILHLGDRPKVRVFLRFDKFDRFVSALVYVPRERYNTTVREKIHAILARAFDGRMSSAHPSFDESALARVHFIIGRNPGQRPHADIAELESEIRGAIRTWEDGFAEAAHAAHGDAQARQIIRRYGSAFSPGYRGEFTPEAAIADVERLEAVREGKGAAGAIEARVYAAPPDLKSGLRIKLFVQGSFLTLSECLPVFENLGLKVISEDSFPIRPAIDGASGMIAVQNFAMSRADGGMVDLAKLKPRLEDAFHAILKGDAESDGFNRLVTAAEMAWRDVTILRAAAKFLRQGGLALSQAYIENALAKNPDIARLLVELFHVRHDPDSGLGIESRQTASANIRGKIDKALNDVPSADDDRIIRSLGAAIEAVLRSNFFQQDAAGGLKRYTAYKIDSRALDFLPAPKPLVEIFVYAPEVEGVHLRFGRVARGGIRWSDRAEDFRTEVLSLVKAQQVKNAVIVPVGAKGGFYPKRLPVNATREAVQEAAIGAYKTFIGALLDVTDNIAADGAIVPPSQVVRLDADDPYLVVAADKGTATFSDIANAIALSRNFWLGDAFASGGSKGYDHKKMGITARGAWEAVKRHFREMGRDIQSEAFSCIGVGDMSGDVFGNGMLLSQQTRLLAAFDHRHIFVDPAPDAAASWAERKRLFDLPRSSWDDYDKKLISAGGGVFPRSAKDIALTPEIKALTGLAKDRVTPTELMRALLTAPIDLLWFGGIGTYIKSAAQAQSEAGDRANDALRVNGGEVRARVIGEGANLAVTQLGRIEFAQAGGPEKKGGRIDTDAIDNSAGVDTSDHEVNIKILMSGPFRRGELSENERDEMLASMTDDVAHHVLADNYDQTEALSVAESTAPRDLDAAWRFMRELERTGRLDRGVEYLPADEELRARAAAKRGLTRPELSVLLAYAKLDLNEAVIESPLPDADYFARELTGYFPPRAAQRFAGEMASHRLRRELITTTLVNRCVNMAGPLFVQRMHELSGAPSWMAARAFAVAESVFGLDALKRRIDAQDLKVSARTQIAMMSAIAGLLRRIGLWFIVRLPANAHVSETIALHTRGVEALQNCYADCISAFERDEAAKRFASLTEQNVPEDLAHAMANLPILSAAPEIVLIAEAKNCGLANAASAFFAAGDVLGLDRLRAAASAVAGADHWDRLALRRIIDDLFTAQRMVAVEALASTGEAAEALSGRRVIEVWTARHQEAIAQVQTFLDDLGKTGAMTIAKLALANSQIQKITVIS